MKISRSEKAGMGLVYGVMNMLPKSLREDYSRGLLKKIKGLKFKERKKGTPMPKECRRPLDGIDVTQFNFSRTEDYKLEMDEIMQILYGVPRARPFQRGIIMALENYIQKR